MIWTTLTMRETLLFCICLIICSGVALSQVVSRSEYERANKAITELIENTEDLPRAVRLGKSLL